MPLTLAGVGGTALAHPDAVRVAVSLVDAEMGNEDLLTRQRGGEVVDGHRHVVAARRVEGSEKVVDQNLDLVATGGRRGHRIHPIAARATAGHQPPRTEVVEHLEGVERGLADTLKCHETEHAAERKVSTLAQDVRTRWAARFVEDVGQHPVRKHVQWRRVALVLVRKQLDALEDEARVPVVVHAQVCVAGVAALTGVRGVPLGVE